MFRILCRHHLFLFEVLKENHQKYLWEEFEKGFAIGESLSALPCPARTTDPAIMGFLEAINRQHPTHQQNIFRVIYLLCRAWAENKAKGWYDLRNEATVEGAERIVKALDNLPIPYV